MHRFLIGAAVACLALFALLGAPTGEATDRPGAPITLPHEPVLHLLPSSSSSEPASEGASAERRETVAGPIELAPSTAASANAPWIPEGDVRLDRDTRQEGDLRYGVVFSPSVAPWKRTGARSVVRTDRSGAFVLGLRTEPRHAIEVGGEPAPGALRFTGRTRLDLEPGVPAAVPSVSPCMQVHEVRTWPLVSLRWFRDGDDNVWVQSPTGGPIEVEYDVSASPAYFGLGAPTGAVTPPRYEPLPASHRTEALELLQIAGIAPELDAGQQVDALATWLRAFESGAPPTGPSVGSALLDIGVHQLGVCRHRAFLFVVATQALGVPARYVFNEAHAFAEVFTPLHGWVRVDLGGDARSLTLEGDPSPEHLASADGDTDPHRVVTGRTAPPERAADAGDASAVDTREGVPLGAGSESATPDTGHPGEAVWDPPSTLRLVPAHDEAVGTWRLGETASLRGRVVVEGGPIPEAVDIWLDVVGEALPSGLTSIRAGHAPVEGGQIDWSRELPPSWVPGHWRVRLEPAAATQAP